MAYAAPPSPAGGAGRTLVGPLDLVVSSGSSHLLLGRNGSGKTALIRILAGLAAPSAGRFLLGDEEIRVGPEGRSLWPEVGALFEEPDPQFLSDTVEGEIAFGLESLGIPPREVRERTASALRDFGLAPLGTRTPQSLSAGEKARTLLAAALVATPRCLLLDQSLAHLDPGSRRELERRVVGEAMACGRAVIRTHQEAEPPLPGETLHVLEGGTFKPASQLTPRAVLEGAGVPFPLALRVSALLAIEGRWSGPLAADAEQVERVMLGAGGAEERTARAAPSQEPEGRLAPVGPRGPAALTMRRVAWSAAGRRGAPLLSGLDLEICRGEIVALIGRSGSGKTTLLKLAAGIVDPTEGTVHREHSSVPRVRPVALALEYPERQLFGRTLLEDVAALLWVEGIPAEERARSARRAMADVGLDPDRFADRFPVSLSEGEKRRAALAGLIVEPPEILLLDEPTAGLDPEGRRALAQVMNRLRERGRTVLLASHDLGFVATVASRVLVLTRGDGDAPSTLVQGTTADVLRDDRLLTRTGIPEPDFVRLERALRPAGLLGPLPVRDEASLLEAVARGAAAPRPA
ncbi:MAG TPA: ATP-binding cassette domain-containing protein [Candidatus Eisenbacteria bacterium]